jgi:ligand-binding SRPBCC domain-containing protein
MPEIKIYTFIQAPIAICFDLARSIDLHIVSQEKAGEKAVAGVTSGLINLHEKVTWEARHFGIVQQLETQITEFRKPYFFADEMVKGSFKSFRHEHFFQEQHGGTLMTDIFKFESPFGLVGKVFNWLLLTRYMQKLLEQRNRVIKEVAESGKWEELLKPGSI